MNKLTTLTGVSALLVPLHTHIDLCCSMGRRIGRICRVLMGRERVATTGMWDGKLWGEISCQSISIYRSDQ